MTIITSSTKAANDTVTAANNNAQRLDDLIMAGDYATAGGTANALTLAKDAQVVAYVEGMTIKFKASADNTGAATINVGSLGVKTLKRNDGIDLLPGDIITAGIYTAIYDGTYFKLQCPSNETKRDYGDGSDGALSVSLGAEETKEDNTSNPSEEYINYTTNQVQGCAWTFTPSASYLCTKLHVWLKKTGSPTGTLTFKLYRINKVNTPGNIAYQLEGLTERWGMELASITQSVSSLTTSFAEYTLTWATPCHIVNGEKYLIEVTSNTAQSTVNYASIYQSTDDISESWYKRYDPSGGTDMFLRTAESGYYQLEGKSNAVELDTEKVYQYSSISVDDGCQIIPMRSAFQNKPCIVKCQGDCDLEGAYINALGNGCNDTTVAPFGGEVDNNGANSSDSDVAPQIGNVSLLYGVFCGGKGGYGYSAGADYSGGAGGGAFVLAVGGDLNVTDLDVDVRGETGWHAYSVAINPKGGGGGGGGGSAAIWYAGSLTGTVTFTTDAVQGGGGGDETGGAAGSAYDGGCGGAGKSAGQPGNSAVGDSEGGDGGYGGTGAGIIAKYF